MHVHVIGESLCYAMVVPKDSSPASSVRTRGEERKKDQSHHLERGVDGKRDEQ